MIYRAAGGRPRCGLWLGGVSCGTLRTVTDVEEPLQAFW